MSELLNDMLNLQILENICSGIGVEVNYSALSKSLKKHRKTVKSCVNDLFVIRIINQPIYPFLWLYQEYPLLIIVRADLPRNEEVDRFLKEDENIFAAFFIADGEYNTLLIEYHEDLYSYSKWRKKIVKEKKIPPRDLRYPADALFFSNKEIIKYQPYSPIVRMEEKFRNGEDIIINGYKMGELSFRILRKLLMGEGIRTNENMLSRILNVHRRTIERRISTLIKEGILSEPVCRFPNFFVPPNKILVYDLVEIKSNKAMDNVLRAIKSDPHIPLALEACMGRYNLLLFEVFSCMESHIKWQEDLSKRYPDSFGAMKKIYLSPRMTASIDQQKVSLGIIRKRKQMLQGREFKESLKLEQ